MRHSRLLLAALVLALAFGAAEVAAHLSVLKTAPARQSTVTESPGLVQVWFSQQPSPRLSRLELTGPGGEVPLGDVQIDSKERSISASIAGALAPGRYEVAWRTAGDDGHLQRGTFTFTVKPSE